MPKTPWCASCEVIDGMLQDTFFAAFRVRADMRKNLRYTRVQNYLELFVPAGNQRPIAEPFPKYVVINKLTNTDGRFF